jgi:integrase
MTGTTSPTIVDGQLTQSSTETTPGALAPELRSAHDYAAAEKADATRRAYRSDWQDFAAFCAARGLSPLPAESATLAAYAAGLADSGRKYSTIRRRVAAIAYAHRLKGLERPDQAEAVKAVLRGIRRRIGVAVKRKAPATARAIGAMLKKLPETLAGKRDRALLLIGFAAALRRSELVDLKVNNLEFVADGVIVHLPKSKTDQEGEGQFVAVPNGRALRPVEALRAWLDAAGITEGPVFRPVGKGKTGAVKPERLSGKSVAEIVKRACARCGLDAALFSGHSLRAGFVTEALERGADPINVMRVTRHVEINTLIGYDRRAKAFKDHAGKKFL